MFGARKAHHLLGMVLSQTPSSFSVDAFTSGSFEGEGDTRRLRLEPNDYRAMILGPFGEQGKTRIKNEKGYAILEVVWQVEDEALRAKLGVDRLPTARQSIFLDITDNGGLDMGDFKNADLNILRDVVGLRKKGEKWSFQQFIGRPALIKVEHKPNEKDSQNPFVNVTKVTRI